MVQKKKVVAVNFKKSCAERRDKVQGIVGPRSATGLPFTVPEIREVKAFQVSEQSFPEFSRDTFLGYPRRLPEFADWSVPCSPLLAMTCRSCLVSQICQLFAL